MRTFLATVLACSACASREEGIEVTVSLQMTSPPSLVRSARLSVTHLRLVPCTEVLAAFSPLSTAWAHGSHASAPASPLEVSLAADVDLLATEPVQLAAFAPPPGELCGVELEVAPSSTDAPWKGTTLSVDAVKGASARQYFSLSSRRTLVRALPLGLGASSRHHALRLVLDGAVFSTLEPAVNDARRELLDSSLASMTLASDLP